MPALGGESVGFRAVLCGKPEHGPEDLGFARNGLLF